MPGRKPPYEGDLRCNAVSTAAEWAKGGVEAVHSGSPSTPATADPAAVPKGRWNFLSALIDNLVKIHLSPSPYVYL